MAQKTIKKTVKPRSPKPPAAQVDTAYLVREDLDEQQERLRKAEAAGANALKTPAQPAVVEQPSAPVALPLKPLAPLAALWPDPVASKGESTPSQAPAPQKAPVAAIAPKPAPATAPLLAQPPAQLPSSKSTEKAAMAGQAHKSTAIKTVNVIFALLEPDAKQVSLCGDFNGWASHATPMKRHGDGHWETTVALAPGRYQYKLIVDGEWIADPLARENVWNQHGTLNSVVEVRA
jgi:hypothetical protein